MVRAIAVALATLMPMLASEAFGQAEPELAIAVGEPGSSSHRIGAGLASLLETEGLSDGTKVRAELWESLSPADRLVVLLEEVQLAVVPDDTELQDPQARQEIRAVAAGLAEGHRVLIRADLSDDVAYRVTELIFEHSDALQPASAEAGDLELRASLERVAGTVHPGALRYYEEHREQVAAVPPEDRDTEAQAAEPREFTVYFDFDVAAFDMDQIGIVQEACGYAGSLPSAEFVLAGHADTVGPEPYNDHLSLARAQSVAGVIRNDPRFRDALHLIRFGESRPAVATGDEVKEPKNRRVVITVVPGKVDPASLDEVSAAIAPAPESPTQP